MQDSPRPPSTSQLFVVLSHPVMGGGIMATLTKTKEATQDQVISKCTPFMYLFSEAVKNELITTFAIQLRSNPEGSAKAFSSKGVYRRLFMLFLYAWTWKHSEMSVGDCVLRWGRRVWGSILQINSPILTILGLVCVSHLPVLGDTNENSIGFVFLAKKEKSHLSIPIRIFFVLA